jgi:ribosomal protein L37AE/L43A
MQNSVPVAETLPTKNRNRGSVVSAEVKTWRNLFFVTSVEININLLIEHQCPQCGAPALLEETDRLFSCDFCRVKSYLLEPGFFRYLLPDKAPPGQSLIYMPYWRFKGTQFSCVTAGIQHRFIDVSHPANTTQIFPMSLGLRSQALKLRFATPETKGHFLKPDLPLKSVMDIFDQRFRSRLPEPVFLQSHIGESISLIYSPFYMKERLYDAIINKPLANKLPDDFDLSKLTDESSGRHIKFIPTLCPDCGWDMHGERDSLVLMCKNCNSMWKAGKQDLQKIKFAYLAGQNEKTTYLPFWRIKTKISGIDLNSFADMARVANLPKAIQDEWEKIPFRFWGLAFKVRPQTFVNLSRNITLGQPRGELVEKLPEGSIHPVTLPISEAVESLSVTLASFIKPARKRYPELPTIKIRPKAYALIYIPFREGHHEYVQPELNLTINKNQLALAGNL